MDHSILEDLGLTEAEIKVYVSLLELGTSTAGPILEKSRLQNSVVHRALHTLIDKGLINYILEGKRKIYQATDPEHFYSYIEEKKKRFTELLPELKAKQQLSKQTEAATVYKGIRGVTEVYTIMVNTEGKEYNTFGGGIECANRMGGAWWMRIHRKRIENKLPSRQVFDESVRPLGGDILELPKTNVRFLSKEFGSFQETVIVGDTVAITVFTENPYSILIKDPSVAESYRKHFEVLWEQAK